MSSRIQPEAAVGKPPETGADLRLTSIPILIPAYRPNETLIGIAKELVKGGAELIIVVDDGSGPAFEPLFLELEQLAGVKVLRHAVNLGKGAALKTGINYALTTLPDLEGVVTADADGQHDPADILRIAQVLAQSPEALVLGAREFSNPQESQDIPLRSRLGNTVTSRVMRVVLGQKLADTQTGLRAVPRALLAPLLKVPATGYEFELEMLVAAKHQSLQVIEHPIRTIYEPGNPASHFQPLRDSMRIYFVLLRFSMISLMTAVIDNAGFYLLFHATGMIAASQVCARLISVTFNYRCVRQAVFFSDQKNSVLLPRYLLLAAVNTLLSYTGIRMLSGHTPLGVFPSKILTESLLFIVNFTIQRDFIFTRRVPSGRNS